MTFEGGEGEEGLSHDRWGRRPEEWATFQAKGTVNAKTLSIAKEQVS